MTSEPIAEKLIMEIMEIVVADYTQKLVIVFQLGPVKRSSGASEARRCSGALALSSLWLDAISGRAILNYDESKASKRCEYLPLPRYASVRPRS